MDNPRYTWCHTPLGPQVHEEAGDAQRSSVEEGQAGLVGPVPLGPDHHCLLLWLGMMATAIAAATAAVNGKMMR
jgi:hypothetical protein